jgi:hypothetical protein
MHFMCSVLRVKVNLFYGRNQQMHNCEDVQLIEFYLLHRYVSVTLVTIFSVPCSNGINSRLVKVKFSRYRLKQVLVYPEVKAS